MTEEPANGEQASGAEIHEIDRADMERLAAGYDAALNDLMERHSAKLFNYLVRCLQNEEDAADLAQETFVRIYQNRAKFETTQKLATWLYAIATNLVKDRYRHRTRHPQVSLDAESEVPGHCLRSNLPEAGLTPSETAVADERAEIVRRAVAALPDELRTPLILAEYEEKRQTEIAQILGCSIKAVETRIYRARKQLREVLSALLQI